MSTPPSTGQALRRGLSGRCPRCGQGRLYEKPFQFSDTCAECALPFEPKAGDHFGLIYLTTAAVTVLGFTLVITLRPQMGWPAKVAFVGVGVAVMLASFPFRKGLAIAVDYLVSRSNT